MTDLLSELEAIVDKYEEQNGYSQETVKDKIIFLVEELGEFTQAYLDGKENTNKEFCDICFLCVGIKRRLEKERKLDFEKEFKEKFKVV